MQHANSIWRTYSNGQAPRFTGAIGRTRLERARERLEKPPEDGPARPVINGAYKKLSKQMLWVMEKPHLINEVLAERERVIIRRMGDSCIHFPLPMGTRRDGVRMSVLVDALLREGKAKSVEKARASLSRTVRRLWYRAS